jgi:hypothetical protein
VEISSGNLVSRAIIETKWGNVSYNRGPHSKKVLLRLGKRHAKQHRSYHLRLKVNYNDIL